MLKLTHRKGAATILAMIFIVVFFAIGIAFATSNMNVIKSVGNEQAFVRAQSSADSGIEFYKSVISACPLDGQPGDDELLSLIQQQVNANMPSLPTTATTDASGTITRLSFGQIQPLGSDLRFSAVLDRLPVTTGGKTANYLVLSVTGADLRRNLTRTASVRFEPETQNGVGALPFLDYGLWAGGKVTMSGGGKIQVGTGTENRFGSVYSARTSGRSVEMSGSFSIPGKVSVASNVKGQVSYGDNSVNGAKRPYWPPEALEAWLAQNFSVVEPPEMPEFETSEFRDLATNVWVKPANNGTGLNDVQGNVRIPRNSGTTKKPLKINGNGKMELHGIVYIESPNNVEITGGPNKLNCIFVFEKGASTTDSLVISGNSQLGNLPDLPEYSAVKTALAGYSFLAPNAKVELNASTNSGEFLGSLVCSTIKISGASDYKVKNGSVVALSNADDAAQLVGSGSIYFTRDADFQPPTTGVGGGGGGVKATRYVLMPGTYTEAE